MSSACAPQRSEARASRTALSRQRCACSARSHAASSAALPSQCAACISAEVECHGALSVIALRSAAERDCQSRACETDSRLTLEPSIGTCSTCPGSLASSTGRSRSQLRSRDSLSVTQTLNGTRAPSGPLRGAACSSQTSRDVAPRDDEASAAAKSTKVVRSGSAVGISRVPCIMMRTRSVSWPSSLRVLFCSAHAARGEARSRLRLRRRGGGCCATRKRSRRS